MKYLLSLIVVLLLVIAGYWLFTNEAESPTNEVTSVDTVETDGEEDAMVEAEENADTLEQESDPALDDVVIFDIKGTNYAFDMTELTVTEGDTVTINFESSDGFHDWVIDEFDAATEQVRPGTPTSVTFVADQPGTFEYYCSVGNHRAQGMVGTLTVMPR
jgi:plastocyanin